MTIQKNSEDTEKDSEDTENNSENTEKNSENTENNSEDTENRGENTESGGDTEKMIRKIPRNSGETTLIYKMVIIRSVLSAFRMRMKILMNIN